MSSYCLKCEENIKNNILQVSKAINDGTIILSKCDDKKSKSTKKQEAKRLLNNLVIRTLLSNIPILRDILFLMQFH